MLVCGGSDLMNLRKLKQAEAAFLQQYPGAFDNPEIVAMREKKHKSEKMIALAQESFSKANFKLPELIAHNMIKVVSRSSIISVFEKPRFRDFVNTLPSDDKKSLSNGLKELLHGQEQTGFEIILEILISGKLAKWSLM